MSYAGTYGADETCRHDCYYRSCAFCWPIGPQATDEQIAARFEREARERQERAEAERQRQRAYIALSSDERKVAEALWARMTPGLNKVDLQAAVEHRPGIDSNTVSAARRVCQQAKIAVAVLQ
jgi:hypothetical protein